MRVVLALAAGSALDALLELQQHDTDALLREIRASPLRAVLPAVPPSEMPAERAEPLTSLPTVTAHGMGDSCFEPGFFSVTKAIGAHTGTYAKCIPTGNNILTDTINGFLLSMDKSVDVFAEKIRADPKLSGGFNAAGFSQGNSLIRGYIQKYNDPPVKAFLSVHGTVEGVAAFPNCFQQEKPLGLLCKAIAEVCGDLAYNSLVQGHLFQADYYRDPKKVGSAGYKQHSQLAAWNLENAATNATLAANFGKTGKFAMVKALKDSMVYPNEGEWWGAAGDGYSTLAMKDTPWYKADSFGLQTADKAGKLFFETTPGDHLQFTTKELLGWVDRYFADSGAVLV